jgi:hypothetical protein
MNKDSITPQLVSIVISACFISIAVALTAKLIIFIL